MYLTYEKAVVKVFIERYFLSLFCRIDTSHLFGLIHFYRWPMLLFISWPPNQDDGFLAIHEAHRAGHANFNSDHYGLIRLNSNHNP